ncbi:hypothetical protein [Isobaculum melis]|uniref:Uncharacterized protein n=1 Tax=Isobaculum melis TaxID=142588 RepID=A0A1H9RKV5_9LACT|nr:hypothetical protein [Isobaculum melis]SER73390.1 hypothetical protein SAMN04488559_104131 [Isobaculum melis]
MEKSNRSILNEVAKAKLGPFGFMKHKNNPRKWVKDCGYFFIWIWIDSSSFAERYRFQYGVQFLHSRKDEVTMYLSETCATVRAEDYLNENRAFEQALIDGFDELLSRKHFARLAQSAQNHQVFYEILLEDEATKDYSIGWMWRYWYLTYFCFLFNQTADGNKWLEITKQEVEKYKYFEMAEGKIGRRDFVFEFEKNSLLPFIKTEDKQQALEQMIKETRSAYRAGGVKKLPYDLFFEREINI